MSINKPSVIVSSRDRKIKSQYLTSIWQKLKSRPALCGSDCTTFVRVKNYAGQWSPFFPPPEMLLLILGLYLDSVIVNVPKLFKLGNFFCLFVKAQTWKTTSGGSTAVSKKSGRYLISCPHQTCELNLPHFSTNSIHNYTTLLARGEKITLLTNISKENFSYCNKKVLVTHHFLASQTGGFFLEKISSTISYYITYMVASSWSTLRSTKPR